MNGVYAERMDLDALIHIEEPHFLPTPESILTKDNPMRDPLLRDIQHIKRAIVARSQSMKREHVEIIKRTHAGEKTRAVSEAVGLTPATVNKVRKSKDGQELMVLLMQLTLLMDGPLEMQRRHMLWRIACENEIENPKVAIAAIAEMNKVDYQKACLEKGMTGAGTVEIVINANQLPRGALDG